MEIFIDIKSFRSHYGPVVDSASKRNEVPGVFPGGKSGRCVRLTTLPPSCTVVTKSVSLNFLEPSGPFQACNGTDLPLPLLLINCIFFPLVFYERRICSVIVAGKCKLRIFEKGEVAEKFMPKRVKLRKEMDETA